MRQILKRLSNLDAEIEEGTDARNWGAAVREQEKNATLKETNLFERSHRKIPILSEYKRREIACDSEFPECEGRLAAIRTRFS